MVNVCLFGDARSIHVQRLARGLVALGTRVHVVTHKPNDIPGVSVERFCVPGPTVANLKRWTARHVRYLRRFVCDFDVLNVQFLSDWGLTPDLIDQGCVIATPWGSDVVVPPNEGVPTSELTEARRMMLRQCSAVTTCGPSFAEVVADFAAVDRARIDVLPFGVDLRVFDPDRVESTPRRARSTDPPCVVGFYKGFRAVYGPTTLMRAIPIVLQRAPRTRFELVGDGVQLDECHSMAQSFGIGDVVTWLPRCPHEEVPELLGRWDVSVIPSVHEAFGVAALESSAMRVPVVASDVCGLRDTVVDGQTGRLVPPGDPEALADVIVDLLSDRAERRRMGEAGWAFVAAHFEAADVHRRWLRYFERVRDGRCVMV